MLCGTGSPVRPNRMILESGQLDGMSPMRLGERGNPSYGYRISDINKLEPRKRSTTNWRKSISFRHG